MSLDSPRSVSKIFCTASMKGAETLAPMNPIPLRALCTFFVAASALLLSADTRAQAPATAGAAAGKSIVGEWEGHVVEGDGSNAGQRRMNIFLTITDKKITATGGPNQMMGEGTYTITGDHIDATGTTGNTRATPTSGSSRSKAAH